MKKILMIGFFTEELEALIKHLEETGFQPGSFIDHLKSILEDK